MYNYTNVNKNVYLQYLIIIITTIKYAIKLKNNNDVFLRYKNKFIILSNILLF